MTAGNIIGGLVFGSIGFVAFVYGKKLSSFRALGIGVALMIYPYFVRSTVWLYVVGVALTVSLYFFRD